MFSFLPFGLESSTFHNQSVSSKKEREKKRLLICQNLAACNVIYERVTQTQKYGMQTE